MEDGGSQVLKSSGQVKGLEERSLTPADLVFHFIPIEPYLWLKQHDLKAEKGNLCPVIPMGLGSYSGRLWLCLGGREKTHPTKRYLVWWLDLEPESLVSNFCR